MWPAELGTQEGQSRKGGAFSSRGHPWELPRGRRFRLADVSSSRYAAGLVPGSPEAAAATTRLEAEPHRRAKQLLCKQPSQHRHVQVALPA